MTATDGDLTATVVRWSKGHRHYEQGHRYSVIVRRDGESRATNLRLFAEVGSLLGRRFVDWQPVVREEEEPVIQLPSYRPVGFLARLREWMNHERTATA